MNIKEKTWFPVVYMFLLTLFLSTILIIFGSLARQRVKDNERIAFERAVLEALPIDLPEKASPSEIHRIYLKNIKDPTDSTAEALRYMRGDTLIAYVLPVEGPGFWATIKGVIGIAIDKKTITGVSFYEQRETPGLGGEIVKPNFRNQFVDKRLKKGIPLEFRMVGAELDEGSVHTITGATQTSIRLAEFLNGQIARWLDAMNEKRENDDQ